MDHGVTLSKHFAFVTHFSVYFRFLLNIQMQRVTHDFEMRPAVIIINYNDNYLDYFIN